MSSNQAVIASSGSVRPGLAILVATAFAIGALLGVAVQGAFDRVTVSTAAATREIPGVAENMGDAANVAQHATVAGTWRGVAENNMGDAANVAQHAIGTTLAVKGVADNSMSDAARLAMEGSSR
jgi:uncharacterized membrane protein YciS (DUF1049 family)